MASRLIGILSLKGEAPSQVANSNDSKPLADFDTLQEQSSTIPKLTSSEEGIQKTSSSSGELPEAEDSFRNNSSPRGDKKKMHLVHASKRMEDKEGNSSSNGRSNNNKSAKSSSAKEEDHDSGTTSNTSMNGDNSTPAIEESDESSEDEDEIELQVNPITEESDDKNDDDDAGETGAVNSKTTENDDDFTSPGLRWYNPVRRFCGRIVNDEMFQVFIVILIILNAALMGIGTYNFVENNPRIQKAFDLADLVFLIIFTIECALQLGYHGYQLFKDGWLTFDLLVVLFSWSMDSVRIFRAIRVFRAFRLVARLAVLKDLVNAIVAVLPRIGSIMLLFCLVLYIYAVLCTILYGDSGYGEDDVDYFGRLDYSLFTLFQFVTLENWGEVSREVKAVHPSFTYIVLSFLTVSSFILYSLVVAVVCDAVAVVEHPDIALRNFEEQMKKERSKTKKRVFKLTTHLDDLSQQQMEVLTSVQHSLMKYNSFREDAKDSQMQAAEMQAAALHLYIDHDT